MTANDIGPTLNTFCHYSIYNVENKPKKEENEHKTPKIEDVSDLFVDTRLVRVQDPVTGKFIKGHPFLGGNNQCGPRFNFQKILQESVQPRFPAIVQVLIEKALAGEAWAIIQVLDRVIGRPVTPVDARIISTTMSMEERKAMIKSALNVENEIIEAEIVEDNNG